MKADFNLPQMTFREFRDKAQWAALSGGVVIVAGQWLLHDIYLDRAAWIDRTPPALNLLGFITSFLTVVLAILTIPRWQSFVAGAAVLWVIFIWIQGV
jgi:hypothetical protein